MHRGVRGQRQGDMAARLAGTVQSTVADLRSQWQRADVSLQQCAVRGISSNGVNCAAQLDADCLGVIAKVRCDPVFTAELADRGKGLGVHQYRVNLHGPKILYGFAGDVHADLVCRQANITGHVVACPVFGGAVVDKAQVVVNLAVVGDRRADLAVLVATFNRTSGGGQLNEGGNGLDCHTASRARRLRLLVSSL